jgi:hypothetical protein
MKCPLSNQECECGEVNPMCEAHASCIKIDSDRPDMGDCVRTIEVWNRLASSDNTENDWITEFWALALQLERELQIAHDRMLNNPWCAACKEPDCCVSGDGTCAMIRKYLSENTPAHPPKVG